MNRTLVSGVVATVAASAVLACSLISLPPPIAPIQIGLDDIESPRLSRRLQTLRGWSHEQQIDEVRTRGA